MNRFVFVALAVLSSAPAARAEEESSTPAPAADVSALEGRIASIEEQYAETKTAVAALGRIKWSGYVQGRYAYQQCVNNKPSAGCSYNAWWADAKNTSGPDRDNFFIRRGRLKVVYDADLAQLVVQLDATPSGVSIKEGYASLKLPKLAGVNGLAIDAGLQLMPFGYDVGVRSSSDLDLLERYRGAGNWLKGEYDVGVTLRGAYGPVSFRGGVFNGNGVDGGGGKDNDPLKDFIGRVAVDLGMVTGGVSGWWGKTRDFKASPDKTYDRKRLGADVQVYLDLLPVGGTALKGEFLVGTTGIGSGAGADLGVTGHAWHAALTQNLGDRLQLAARFEQYVKDNNLASSGPAVKEIHELDVAAHYYVGGNYKLSALWAHPMDGKKIGSGPGTPSGTVEDTDQFVVQAQAKF